MRAWQGAHELRALSLTRYDDPMPNPRTAPLAYLDWQHREAQRQADEAKWADYAP